MRKHKSYLLTAGVLAPAVVGMLLTIGHECIPRIVLDQGRLVFGHVSGDQVTWLSPFVTLAVFAVVLSALGGFALARAGVRRAAAFPVVILLVVTALAWAAFRTSLFGELSWARGNDYLIIRFGRSEHFWVSGLVSWCRLASIIVLPCGIVAAAGFWILAYGQEGGSGRRHKRLWAGACCLLSVAVALGTLWVTRYHPNNIVAWQAGLAARVVEEVFYSNEGVNDAGSYIGDLSRLVKWGQHLTDDPAVTFVFGDCNASGYTYTTSHARGNREYRYSSDYGEYSSSTNLF